MERKKNILLTGASGFVGKNLLEYLKGKNFTVRALIHKKDIPLENPVTEKVYGDISDISSLEKAFLGEPLDGIVHLAAVIKSKSPEDYAKINIEGTRNVVKLAEKYGVKKFIFLSSDFTLYENIAPNPYGISKSKCEKIILNSQLDFTIFRPTPIFGPGDNKNFVSLSSLIKKLPIVPALHCYMEPVFVGDVAKMITAALENPISDRQIYYLPGGKGYDFPEILKIVAKNQGLKRLIITFPAPIFLFALRAYEMIFPNPLLESYQVKKWLKTKPLDAGQAKKDLGYNPISFEAGIRFIFKNAQFF